MIMILATTLDQVTSLATLQKFALFHSLLILKRVKTCKM